MGDHAGILPRGARRLRSAQIRPAMRKRVPQPAREVPMLRTYIICLNMAALLRFGLARWP